MGYGARDPRSGMEKNPSQGSGINETDPQHWRHKQVQFITKWTNKIERKGQVLRNMKNKPKYVLQNKHNASNFNDFVKKMKSKGRYPQQDPNPIQ